MLFDGISELLNLASSKGLEEIVEPLEVSAYKHFEDFFVQLEQQKVVSKADGTLTSSEILKMFFPSSTAMPILIDHCFFSSVVISSTGV